MKRIKLKSLILMLIVALTLIGGVTIAAKENLPPIVKPGQAGTYEPPSTGSTNCTHPSSKREIKSKKATCTESGYTKTVCSVCEKQLSYSVIQATGHSGGVATCVSPKMCTNCGVRYGTTDPNNHTDMKLVTTGDNDNSGTHWKHCSGCGAEPIPEGNHQYGIDHACRCGAVYKYGKEHRFSEYGGRCTAYNSSCTAYMFANLQYGNELPLKLEYKMVDAVEDYPHVELDYVTVNFSYPPYISEEGGKKVGELLSPSDITVNYITFYHGNYNDHLGNVKDNLTNNAEMTMDAESVDMGVYKMGSGVEWYAASTSNGEVKWYTYNEPAVNNINKQLGHWTGAFRRFGELLNQEEHELTNGVSVSKTSYKFNTSNIAGHAMIDSVSINMPSSGASPLVAPKLFCNGECEPKTVNIYAHLRVAYRTVNGEKFEGLGDTYYKTSVYNNGAKNSSVTVDIQHGIPDIAGYRFVGYKIHEGSVEPGGAIGNDRSGLTTMSPGVNQTVTVPMKFTKQEINKSITFYYEPVRLTVRHYNMTNSTENPVKIITSNNITKEFIPFNQLALVNGKVQIPPKIDFDTYSLSKFWWPAYNLEYVTMSTIEDSNLNANSFRKITFHPYKVFAPTAKDPAQCASIVNSTTSIGNAIRQIYEIDADAEKDLIIDIIKNMATDADQNEAKRQLASANNLLVYARLKDVDLIEDISEIRKQSEANISSTKLVSALEDCLLSKGDKESQIKKKITLPYAPEITGKISEFPAYRSDKYVKYYYTTTEIMVNNINLETEEFIQSLPDNNNNTYDMRTKVPIRDTQFRAESLITTPPAREDLKYSYSVYNPTDKTFTRRQYDITGYVLEKFDIKVGDEVILSVTASDAEEWYTIDGSASTLYPPFSEQFIIDTSTPGGIGSYINATLSQLDLNRLDKDASVNFYYRDVSLLKIKYVRDTDFAEILPSKTKILSTEKEYISPEKIKNYEYDSYILDGNKGEGTKVEVVELPNGQDRELIFIYKVPQLDPTLDFADRQYVDLRSNDRVPASDIMQEEYQTAEPRLKNGKYSDKYKSLEEYNTYNDKERKNDQSNEGIPTLEDLYANVVANQFLVDNALTMQPTTQKLKLKIVRKYYKTNKADSDKTNDDDNVNNQITDKVGIIEVDVETELPYQYYGASGADLKVIENAMVYNNVIDQVELKPNYKLPEMNYIKNGYLYLPVKRSYDDEIRKYTEGVKKGEEDFRNLKSGFYSVVNPTSRTDTLEAVWVIEGIDAYMAGEKESEKIERITREYKDSAFVLLALQEAGTLVHPDKLTITYYSSADGKSKPKEYLIVKDGINKENLNENMKLNITYTAEMLEDMGILYSEDIPLTGTDVLYKNRDLYVKSKTKNGTHGTEGKFGDKYKDNTVAEVNYILHQTIKNEEVVGGPAAKSLQEALGSEYQARFDDARRTKTIIGHPVVVHTPVVNASKFDFDGKNNDYDYSEPNKHTVNEIKGKNGTLVLGQKFDIEIPHKGQHIDAVGYGNNTYNYEGLIANGQTTSSIDGNLFNGVKDKFAIIKQIKFDKVGVILYEKDEYGHVGGGKYYTKNEWINLPLEDEIYTFTIPEWEEEIWDDREVTIETRVAAENIPNDEDKKYYETTESFNGLKPKYGVWKTFKFKVIGELKDLEIRATNDPGYSGYKTGGTSSMPIGQKGQGNGGAAYQYGIKLGYSVYFDIMSTGWTGDTTESVEISPTFYYVGKNGGKADKVDLYYKVTGNPNYVKLEGTGARNLTTIMSTDAVRGPRCKSVYALWANRVYGTGSGFFNANAGQEMANTTKFITALKAEASNYVETKNKPTVNYGLPIGTGTTNAIKLPYSVRLAYTNAVNAMLSQKYAGVTGLEVVSNNAKNYCIGHWYGAYKLPATTVAVEPGVTPKPDKSNTKKNGYIIVVFENVHSNKGTPGPGEKDYLKTDPDQYKSEGANIKNNYPFDLPNGNPAYVPNPQLGVPEPNYIPAIIYETDIAANQDAEIAGTH